MKWKRGERRGGLCARPGGRGAALRRIESARRRDRRSTRSLVCKVTPEGKSAHKVAVPHTVASTGGAREVEGGGGGGRGDELNDSMGGREGTRLGSMRM